MGHQAGSRASPKGRRKRRSKSPKIRNLRPYYNKRALGHQAGSRASPKGRRKRRSKSPKIRNLRPYYNKGALGHQAGSRASPEGRRKIRRSKGQKIRNLRPYYNKRALGHQAGSRASPKGRRKRRSKSPKIRNLRPYYNKGALGHQAGSRASPEGRRKIRRSKGQKIRNLRPYLLRGLWLDWTCWACCTAYIGLQGNPRGIQVRVTRRTRLPQRWCGNAWTHVLVVAWRPRLHWATVPRIATNQKVCFEWRELGIQQYGPGYWVFTGVARWFLWTFWLSPASPASGDGPWWSRAGGVLPKGLLRCMRGVQPLALLKRKVRSALWPLVVQELLGSCRCPWPALDWMRCACVGLSRLEGWKLVIVEIWMEWLGDLRCCVYTASYRPPGEPARYTNMGNAPNQATSKVVRKRLAACVRGCLAA